MCFWINWCFSSVCLQIITVKQEKKRRPSVCSSADSESDDLLPVLTDHSQILKEHHLEQVSDALLWNHACTGKIDALRVVLDGSVQCMDWCVWYMFTADESHPGTDAGLPLEAGVQHRGARHQPDHTIPTDERVRQTRPDGHQRHGQAGRVFTFMHSSKALCMAYAARWHAHALFMLYAACIKPWISAYSFTKYK